MQIARSATSVSWIPSDSVRGLLKVPFSGRVMHYDPPPPLTLTDLEGMRRRGEFRFANILRAWIDVEDGTIRGCGYAGGVIMGLTPITIGSVDMLLPTEANQEICKEPEVTKDTARFVQTAGGRPGFSFLKPSARPPFLVTRPFTVWTTIELTVHADGSSTQRLAGASQFPRVARRADDRRGLRARSTRRVTGCPRCRPEPPLGCCEHEPAGPGAPVRGRAPAAEDQRASA